MSLRVDVIILSWNRVEDTIAAIASAAEQQGVEQSILIVDQGSEPANLLRLKSFIEPMPNVLLQCLPQNVGVAEGRNKATAMGSAPYIVALDSDAVFSDTGALARAVTYLDLHQELCALGFQISNFFTGQNDETSWDYPVGCHPQRRFASSRFIGAGHAIRRSTFEAVQGYDARLFFCLEELDLCYRMLNTGLRIEYFPDARILHKVSPEHRVFWGKGRFFYTSRNGLYISYKFGMSPFRLFLGAAAYVARGMKNGIALEAVRGAVAALAMASAFRRSPEDKSFYQLSAETWRYIDQCEPARRQRFFSKIARQFKRLPHQA